MEKLIMTKKILNLPFTGITSFCRVPICQDWSMLEADVAILGVPFDMGTQCKSGTRLGPRGVRDASAIYSLQDVGYYDHEFDEYFLEINIYIKWWTTITMCQNIIVIQLNAKASQAILYQPMTNILTYCYFIHHFKYV